jgi:hypothetical protein
MPTEPNHDDATARSFHEKLRAAGVSDNRIVEIQEKADELGAEVNWSAVWDLVHFNGAKAADAIVNVYRPKAAKPIAEQS